MAISFNELLILSATLIFCITLYFLYRLDHEGKIDQGGIERPSKFSNLLLRIHYFLVFALLSISVYSIYLGVRPWIYFVLNALIFLTLILLLLHRRDSFKFTVMFTLVALGVVNASIPIVENNLLIFGPDQGGYWVAADSILKEGDLLKAAAISGSYYSFVPLFSLLIACISSVTGCNLSLPFSMLPALAEIIMAFSVYSILLRLTKDRIASVIGVFIFLSTPRLSTVDIIPSIVSMALGSVLILLLLRNVSIRRQATTTVIFFLASAALIFHPVGIVAILSFAGGFTILNYVMNKNRDSRISTKLTTPARMFLFISILSLTYWIFNNTILLSILTPLLNLYASLFSSSKPSIYSPQYYGSGLEVYAFAWALPVAFTATYVAASIIPLLAKKRVNPAMKSFDPVTMACSIVGLLLIIIGFISVIGSPGLSVERYIDNVAYLLLVVPSAFVGALLIKQKRRLVFVSVIIILAAFIGVGASSPDWAPFEHPRWGAINVTYVSNMEAETISSFLPQSSYIYSDNDINLGALAYVKGIYFQAPISFQITRYVLNEIKTGELLTSEYFHQPLTLYVVKISDIDPKVMGNFSPYPVYLTHKTSLIYFSSRHLILAYVG